MGCIRNGILPYWCCAVLYSPAGGAPHFYFHSKGRQIKQIIVRLKYTLNLNEYCVDVLWVTINCCTWETRFTSTLQHYGITSPRVIPISARGEPEAVVLVSLLVGVKHKVRADFLSSCLFMLNITVWCLCVCLCVKSCVCLICACVRVCVFE